ncbi:hypothetical protein BH23VER1_BH23VER1_12550 [soil metagenome]
MSAGGNERRGAGTRRAVAVADEAPVPVVLSLISHTNVGKTTLARTLLRQDVGEAFDQSHVTDTNTAYTLITDGDSELRLWDTPGFGDTSRLLKRLKNIDNPLGWVVSQVWDRFTDRPMWCSQQAVKNVRDEADIVLYLVNAAEDPGASGFVLMEMEILSWIGKPVVVLLNQTGGWARERGAEAAEEDAWRQHLAEVEVVQDVLGLDAFARCWIQEDELLGTIQIALDRPVRRRFRKLRAAWRRENLAIFESSMELLAAQLAGSLADRQEVSAETLAQKIGIRRAERNAELEAARAKLGARLLERTKKAVNELIRIHKLEGETARKLERFGEGSFGEPKNVHESIWGALGGAGAGLLTGLAADVMAGGMTLGGGVIAGTLLGGSGAYFLARGYNLARGSDNNVRWSKDHFVEQVKAALLCYLAVAHFGRGRGAWEDSEYPAHWKEAADEAIGSERDQIEKIWARSGEEPAPSGLDSRLATTLKISAQQVLSRLYPEASAIFRDG